MNERIADRGGAGNQDIRLSDFSYMDTARLPS